MIKIENTEVVGWEAAIRGMRNPMNSWDKSDSLYCGSVNSNIEDSRLNCDTCEYSKNKSSCMDSKVEPYIIGSNDLKLMKNLRKAGTDHRKFMRMITVYVDITAPLYWWKEFDTYKVGTVANSCSTMHKITEKEFTLDDFSCEHLLDTVNDLYDANVNFDCCAYSVKDHLEGTIGVLNHFRNKFIETNDKKYWWQLIQLLPSSYNQKRTIQLNYEVLANIYKSRKNHKLDEWSIGFMDWIRKLPHSELITGEFE